MTLLRRMTRSTCLILDSNNLLRYAGGATSERLILDSIDLWQTTDSVALHDAQHMPFFG